MAALKFAHIKTGDILFTIIYGALVGALNIPVVYGLLFHLEIDSSPFRSPWVKHILGRLPALALLTLVNYGANWILTYTVDEVVKIQTVAGCKL